MRTRVGLIGSGWRAEYFMRVARALAGQFEMVGVVTRSEERAGRFAREFAVPWCKTQDELMVMKPDYTVVCVGGGVGDAMTLQLVNRGMPVFLETPPSFDMEKLKALVRELPSGAMVQVAEQYFLQPMHAARLSYIKKGALGSVSQVKLSVTHGYHAMSLMRKYLGVGFENAEISATGFEVPVMAGPSRAGEPEKEEHVKKAQTVAVFNFGDRVGIYDFETDQHRSWVRSPYIQVKGEKGEIFNTGIKRLVDYKTPMESSFIRCNLGEDTNVEGAGLKGIMADGEWVYKNPWRDARLTDDEIAVAACMQKMAEYIQGGASFYSVAEAAQDTYLATMMDKAANEGVRLRTETQIWANNPLKYS